MESIERMWQEATQLFSTYVPNLVAALLILVIGWVVASIIAKLVQKALSRAGLNKLLKHGVPGDSGDSAETANRIQNGIGRGVFIILMLFVLVAFFEVLGLTQITTPLTGFLNELFVYAPRLIGPLMLVVLAWAAANILRALTRRTMVAARLDERLGSGADLTASSEKAFSDTVSESVYWLTYLVFLPAILSALNLGGLLEPVRAAVTEIIGFLPNVLAAAVILVIGWLVARILRRITTNFLVAVGSDERAELKETFGKQKLSGTVGLIVYILVFVPVLVAALNALQLEAITAPASDMLAEILAVVPNLVAGILIVVVAFYVARIISGLTTGLLTSVGFDNVTKKIGLSNTQLTGQKTTSEIAGYLVHIAIMLFATIEALDLIGFVSLSILITAFLVFSINVVFGLVIIGLGLFLGKFTGEIVRTTNVPNPAVAGMAARTSIIVLAVAMGIRQMGVAEDIIALAFGLTLGALAVAIAIAFGIGGRDAAAKIIEKRLVDSSDK